VGVFSKESAATILGVIVVYELVWWRERRQGWALAAGCIAALLALEGMWYARAPVFFHLPPTRFPYWDNPLVDAGFWEARLTALKVIAKYLGLLFWPANLSCDYSLAQIPMATGRVADWLAWLAVAAAAGSVVLLYRRNRPLFFLWVMACVTFLPVSNLLFPIVTIMAERFLYLPAIAASAVVVCGCFALGRRAGKPGLAPVALSLILAACIARTWVRNADWHDDLSLMRATLATSPASFKSHKLAAGLYDSDPLVHHRPGACRGRKGPGDSRPRCGLAQQSRLVSPCGHILPDQRRPTGSPRRESRTGAVPEIAGTATPCAVHSGSDAKMGAGALAGG